MIPRPVHARPSGTPARLDRGSHVVVDAASRHVAALLRYELVRSTDWELPVHLGEPSPSSSGVIRLRVDPDLRVDRDPSVADAPGPAPSTSPTRPTHDDAYRLKVDAGGIEITGASPSGVFYGTRTLRQLLPPDLLRQAPVGDVDAVTVPGTVVVDMPRFSWRGFHLDVARHFLPKTWILKLIDVLAFHKLNVLHLHLTDDQGWRFPVEGYPKLVEVGAWRRESMDGHHRDGRYDGIPHGGYYTTADLREIVAYAAQRFVTVVPEIDMPGHMQAAIAAYPEIGNGDAPLEVSTSWGISDHVLNLEEPTLRFCTDVLDQVCDVFPSPVIHIGGDECPTVEWEQSPAAQRRKGALGLSDERALQGWFTARMAEHLAGRGRVLAGWDEILDGDAPPGSLVTAWRHPCYGTQAAEAGHDVVMAAMVFLYLDWASSPDPDEPLAIAAAIPTERVYSFEPVPPRLGQDRRHRIVGAQCQLWTEYIRTPAHAEYMAFPRACALSEVAWSSADRHWPDFSARLHDHLACLDALGVNYRPPDGPTPGQAARWRGPSPASADESPVAPPGTDPSAHPGERVERPVERVERAQEPLP
jgi:hexosaminidase